LPRALEGFMVAQPNDPSSDNAAGVGLAIFGVSALVVLFAHRCGFGIARGAKLAQGDARSLLNDLTHSSGGT